MEFADLPEEIQAFSDDEGAVVVINVEGTVVFMNAPAEKLLGVDADDMVGEFVEMLVPEKKRWGHQAYRRGYFAEPNDAKWTLASTQKQSVPTAPSCL